MQQRNISTYSIEDVPEFQRLRMANPQNPSLDALQAILMYGRAIHWMAILEILWPDFDKLDNYRIEVAYITANDPDDKKLAPSFYQHIANMIAMLWEIQLMQKYPTGDWSVSIDDDPEITLEVDIRSRN